MADEDEETLSLSLQKALGALSPGRCAYSNSYVFLLHFTSVLAPL